jgi:hypothetical protein
VEKGFPQRARDFLLIVDDFAYFAGFFDHTVAYWGKQCEQ